MAGLSKPTIHLLPTMLRFRVLLGNDDAGKLEFVTQEVVRRLSFAAGFRISLSPEVGLADFGYQGREVAYTRGWAFRQGHRLGGETCTPALNRPATGGVKG